MTRTARLAAAYGALFCLAAFGLFHNLDDRLLWGDEAETAVLALSITRFGVPRVDDGRNVIANLPDRGDSNDAGIWTWSPWLDEYVAAGSFLALGPSTLAARLPFAALAFASTILLAGLVFSWTRRHEVALIALALYATCVPLLLHGRQARYYALLMVAELGLLHGLSRCLRDDPQAERRHSISGALYVAFALAALFYCNYIVVPGHLIALAGVGLAVWIRRGRPPVSLAAGSVGFAVLVTPWIVYAPASGQLAGLGLQHFWQSLAYYTSEIHFHFVPWIVLALPAGTWALRRIRSEPPQPRSSRPGPSSPASSPSALSESESSHLQLFVWLLLVASLLVYSVSPLRFFRYLIPLAPPLIVLAALLIVNHIRPGWARIAWVSVLVSSNAIAIATAPLGSHQLALPYVTFAQSITSEYHERLDDVLRFLAKEAEASPQQDAPSLWVADPEFPLMFYTDLQIIDARYHPFPEDPPDWVFATSASGLANRRPLRLPIGVRALYDETSLPVRRSARGGNRPDPHAYAWFEAGHAEIEKMRIYHRR